MSKKSRPFKRSAQRQFLSRKRLEAKLKEDAEAQSIDKLAEDMRRASERASKTRKAKHD